MSRSYKRNPIYKAVSKYGKKLANRKVRRTKLPAFRKSNMYRKVYETWDVCDYRFYVPFSSEISKNKEHMNWWRKWYYRK